MDRRGHEVLRDRGAPLRRIALDRQTAKKDDDDVENAVPAPTSLKRGESAASPERDPMQKITTFLTFQGRAEDAVRFYLSIFEGSKILSTMAGPDGAVIGLTFELAGQRMMALNGGPSFTFTSAFSLFVACEDQAEIDRYWARLTDGGKEVQCGWLVDKFGVSWQIVPRTLGDLLGHRDREKAGRAMQAMFEMQKLDIAALERAFEGKA
jgi:predicted 3-demethylubiquinone-9 3-methyltransferase (glyoxalase superfamily)